MRRIVLPVKFDGGLSISVLRNVQLFTKKIRGSKTISFQKAQILKPFKPQTTPFGKRTDHPLEKSLTFLDLNFLANGIDSPPSISTWIQRCFLSID
jgi:hypothetical protein